MATATMLTEVSNDAKTLIEFEEPYVAEFSVTGVAPFLFHRWSVDGVEAKAKAAKGSKAKKEDALESYVYRGNDGITRCRPALNNGWKTRVLLQVMTPEYITPQLLNEVFQSAGRLAGVGDFRPTFGRFQTDKFEVMAG